MKTQLNEFINTLDYMPVLTIGHFLDSFKNGLEQDGKERQNKPIFVRTLTGTLKGDGSKSLFQRWKDAVDGIAGWWAKDSWYFPVLDIEYVDGEIRFIIDSKNFAGKSGKLDAGIGPRDMMAKLTKLRDEDGIKANTKVVVYDNNTGKTLWMYDLRHGYYSRFMKLPRATSMFQEFPNIFDPHAWFDANNAVGIDQSFGIGAEEPEWFKEIKQRSNAKTFGKLSKKAEDRFADAGINEAGTKQYTKQQIAEAIAYWKKMLKDKNYKDN